MGSPGQYLFGNPFGADEEQDEAQPPFLTPSGVSPGGIGPQQAGPSPIVLGQTPDPSAPPGQAPPKSPQAITNEAAQKTASGEDESATEKFSTWLETNKTKSESEWMKEKWKKAGKLGKISMILDSAASGLSGFTSTYIPLTRDQAAPKPHESRLRQQYAQYAGQNKERQQQQMQLLGYQQKETDQRLRAGTLVAEGKRSDFKNQLEYYNALAEKRSKTFKERLDLSKFQAAKAKAQVDTDNMNEKLKLDYLKRYDNIAPDDLEETIADGLMQLYPDPAERIAQAQAVMKMMEETKAKYRGRARAPGSDYPSGLHSNKAFHKWGVDKAGNLQELRGTAFLPSPKGKFLGAQYSGTLDTGENFNSEDYVMVTQDSAKKLTHFMDTTNQADMALQALARAARNDEPMFGLRATPLWQSARRLSAEYGLEKLFGGVPGEEPLIAIARMNASMMHARGQIGYRPAMELVKTLEKEIAGGGAPSRKTALLAMATFRVLTEYSASQLVKKFKMSPADFEEMMFEIEDWVDVVLSGEGDLTNLPGLEELMGSGYTSGLNWGSNSYSPSRFETGYRAPQQSAIGAQ